MYLCILYNNGLLCFSAQPNVDDSERFHRQHELVRPDDGRAELHLQLHPHERPRVGLRQPLLHHQQLHRNRHRRHQRFKSDGNVD